MATVDLVSMATSITAVAGAGIQLSSSLYKYAETVTNADKVIKDIARDLSITSTVVKQLGELLSQDDGEQLLHESALWTARSAVQGCDEVFRQIQKQLDKSLEPIYNGRFRDSMLRRLKWPMVEPKLSRLQVRLESLKNTLVLALNSVTYAREIANRTSNTIIPISTADRINTDEQSLQIERLIILNEQANQRSHGLETAIREIGLIRTTSQTPADATSADNITAQIQDFSFPQLSNNSALDVRAQKASSLGLFSGRADCDCGKSSPPSSQDTVHISRQNLAECANEVRFLLKVLEDAQSSDEAGRCETVQATCRESLNALHKFFP